MICSLCGSSKFRPSHFRLTDLRRLLGFQWPVRCRNCQTRDFAELWEAWAIHRDHHARHRQRQGADHAPR